MRKFIVLSMISLDGVMQAPGGPEEDTSDGFKFGGWVAPFSDEEYDEVVTKELQPTDYLLGRKTFKIWEDYWPEHAEFWPGINEGQKYVLSNTINETDWQHTNFIKNIDEIKELKSSDGRDIQIWGSSKLVQLLLENDLVDELHLKIHPIILGKGKKLFDDNSIPGNYELKESKITSKGVIIATYIRGGAVETGQAG